MADSGNPGVLGAELVGFMAPKLERTEAIGAPEPGRGRRNYFARIHDYTAQDGTAPKAYAAHRAVPSSVEQDNCTPTRRLNTIKAPPLQSVTRAPTGVRGRHTRTQWQLHETHGQLTGLRGAWPADAIFAQPLRIADPRLSRRGNAC